MVQMLDTLLARVEAILQSRWDDSLMWVVSDNGAMPAWSTQPPAASAGSNDPLRGGKSTLYEGGLRVPSFVTGGFISSRRSKGKFSQHPRENRLVHAIDIVPSILGQVYDEKVVGTLCQQCSGQDVLSHLLNEQTLHGTVSAYAQRPLVFGMHAIPIAAGCTAEETNVRRNVGCTQKQTKLPIIYAAALIQWPYKLLLGVPYINPFERELRLDGWWVNSPAYHYVGVQAMASSRASTNIVPIQTFCRHHSHCIARYVQDTIRMQQMSYPFVCSEDQCLPTRMYDINTDASERFDISSTHANVTNLLVQTILNYVPLVVMAQLNLPHSQGNPRLLNWVWDAFM